MNREDILRELELLPAWQLRAPVQNDLTEIMPNLESQPVEKAVAETKPAAHAEDTKKAEPLFDYYVSENNAWIFIRAQEGMAGGRMDTASQACTGMIESSGMLFDNILIALQMKVRKYDGDLAVSGAKVIVAMGEKTAQTLLNSAETIDNLRGKTQFVHNLPLIVTYSAAEILEHLPNKAKTWHDLCSAIRLVNA